MNVSYKSAAIAPIAEVIPPPMAVPAKIPFIPKEVRAANAEPAATFPIAA